MCFKLVTVISVLRKLLAVTAIVALMAPVGVALCASGIEHDCEAAAMHACCEGPRLSDCQCDDSDASRRPSEPAQPFPRVKADTTPIAAIFEAPRLDTAPSLRRARLDASPPPAAVSERLSLLSTLLV